MQRYNMFSQVHKGLRAMLYSTANTLQQTDFTQTNESDAVLAEVSEVLDLFDKHAHSEDHFVLTAIEQHQPDIAVIFEAEHVEDLELGRRIRSLINMFNHTFSVEERNVIGGAIRFAFVEFLVFNLKHMAKEENVLNNLLWTYYTDEALHAITKQILAHLEPVDMAKYSRWMLRGLSNSEIISWLKEVRDNAPGFVFNDLFNSASTELSEHRWTIIKDALFDGAMVA